MIASEELHLLDALGQIKALAIEQQHQLHQYCWPPILLRAFKTYAQERECVLPINVELFVALRRNVAFKVMALFASANDFMVANVQITTTELWPPMLQ